MGVDQTSLDRIRNATFPASRRGYDKHEVEKFLARLADWLETGGGDESRSDTVKRELERVGQRTGAILSQAEESAQQIRSEAEDEAREAITTANAQAEETRSEADGYSKETRQAADAYAEELREGAQQEALATLEKAEQEARETVESAQAQARRIIDEGTQRREDIEAVIADLVRRRDEVLTDTDGLVAKLTSTIGEHRPDPGADAFDKPDELDPLARDGEEPDVDDVEGEADFEMETGEQPEAEPEADAEVEAEAKVEAEPEPEREGEPEEAKPKKTRRKTARRSRKVRA